MSLGPNKISNSYKNSPNKVVNDQAFSPTKPIDFSEDNFIIFGNVDENIDITTSIYRPTGPTGIPGPVGQLIYTTVGDEVCEMMHASKILNPLIRQRSIHYNCAEITIGLFELNEKPLALYVRREGYHYYISDGGYIWCSIKSARTDQSTTAFDRVKKDMNIQLSANNELFVESFSADFVFNFQNMIKAIIFLFYSHVSSKEDHQKDGRDNRVLF